MCVHASAAVIIHPPSHTPLSPPSFFPQPSGTKPATFDATRAARMAGFGTLFYGPYQHFWYRALDAFFPGRSTGAFLAKVTLNQVALAPASSRFASDVCFGAPLRVCVVLMLPPSYRPARRGSNVL